MPPPNVTADVPFPSSKRCACLDLRGRRALGKSHQSWQPRTRPASDRSKTTLKKKERKQRTPPTPTPLPRDLRFSDPEKIRNLYQRFGMRRQLEDVQAFECAITSGGGIVSCYLDLNSSRSCNSLPLCWLQCKGLPWALQQTSLRTSKLRASSFTLNLRRRRRSSMGFATMSNVRKPRTRHDHAFQLAGGLFRSFNQDLCRGWSNQPSTLLLFGAYKSACRL